MILNIIQQYCQIFKNVIYGQDESLKKDDLYGGSKLQFIFSEIFIKSFHKISPFDTISDMEINVAIRNSTGMSSTIFIK